MSFYGSVYYQLVDTFYKVITKNANLTGVSFPETLAADDQTIQALGRKGVLKIANGNRWINFTYNEDDNSFVIWHGTPNTDASLEIGGYLPIGEEAPADVEIVELKAGDYFSTFNAKCDEAGHLVSNELTRQYYRLPKSETEQAITTLQEQVGNPTQKEIIDDQGNLIQEGKEASGLFLATETNATNITSNLNRIVLLEDVYGHDRASAAAIFFDESSPLDFTEEDPYTLKNFPAAFGSIDAIRASYFGTYSTEKTVSDAILEAKNLINIVDEKATSAITNSNYQEQRLDSFESNTNATLAALGELTQTHTSQISALQEKDVALDNEITTIKSSITTLESNTNTTTTELSNRITTLQSNLEAADVDIKNSITTMQVALDQEDSNIKKSITELQGEDTTIKASIISLQTNLEAADASIKTSISDLGTELREKDTELSTAITNLQDQDTAITSQITSIEEQIATLQTKDGNIDTEIAALKTKDESIDTEIAALKAKDVSLEAAHTDINTNISNLNTFQSTITPKVDDLITSVGQAANVDSNVEASGLYKTIADLEAQIATLTTRVEILESYHNEVASGTE